MNKKDLRKIYLEKRGAIPRSARVARSLDISNKLFASAEYAHCSTLFVYSSAKGEVDTSAIINKALDDGKRVAVPKMTDKAHEMVFIEITSLYELTETRYGIAEPVFDASKIITPDKSTLIAVPLVAFDTNGNRLGYGGGYYDTYLSNNEYMCAIGIAFSEQMCDGLMTEDGDIKLDGVLFG